MSDERPIKASIDKRLSEERYIIPKEKKEPRKPFNVQILLTISIVIGLILSILKLMTYF